MLTTTTTMMRRRQHQPPHRHLFLRSFASANKDGNNNGSAAETTSSKGGNFWIRFGWTLLGLVVVDQALQLKHRREDEERTVVLREMQEEADRAVDAGWALEEEARRRSPTLFECRLSHVEPSLDGTKMLTRRRRGGNDRAPLPPLREGDLVEVIEADVGPGRAYHMCRVRPSKEDGDDAPLVGWYPIMFLERVEK